MWLNAFLLLVLECLSRSLKILWLYALLTPFALISGLCFWSLSFLHWDICTFLKVLEYCPLLCGLFYAFSILFHLWNKENVNTVYLMRFHVSYRLSLSPFTRQVIVLRNPFFWFISCCRGSELLHLLSSLLQSFFSSFFSVENLFAKVLIQIINFSSFAVLLYSFVFCSLEFL